MTQDLLKVTKRPKKRLGRGYGSGKGGHTSGRGQKGQKSRGRIGVLFEGVKVKKSLLKKLPFQKGKGKHSAKDKPIIINLSVIDLLPADKIVDLGLLVKKGIVDKSDAEKFGVKILGDGKLTKKFTISLPISKSAAKKVEKAGGKIVDRNLKDV